MTTTLDAYRQVYTIYNEFTADQAMESEDFEPFRAGFEKGREYYQGQVLQVFSDTWYIFNGSSWKEMTVEEQIEWTRGN
jgi:hypothetical protein